MGRDAKDGDEDGWMREISGSEDDEDDEDNGDEEMRGS